MRLALVILGTEVLAITTGETYDEEPGDCTTTPVGFVQRHDIPDEGGMYFDWGSDDNLNRRD